MILKGNANLEGGTEMSVPSMSHTNMSSGYEVERYKVMKLISLIS